MNHRPKAGKELEAKIIAHAWKDPRFKEKLMKNPRAAFKEMGLDIPENIQVKVIEDRAGMYTFVLPSLSSQSRELSDEDLTKVAAAAVDRLGQKHAFTVEIGDWRPAK